MTLWATRCHGCGTSFRVSEEQLKISDGYVRCGRCDTVFNARSTLFDLESASAPVPLDSPPESPRAAQPLRPQAAPAPEAAPEPEPLPELPAMAPPAVPASEALPEPHWDASAASPWPAAERNEPGWLETDTASPAPLPAAAGTVDAIGTTGAAPEDATERMRSLLGAEAPAPPGPQPSAAAAPKASWRSLERAPRAPQPVARKAWNGAGLLLAGLLSLALPLQWAWVEREALRARVPAVDALFERWGLPSTGWQRLDGLRVGSSQLQATPQGGAYRLQLVLVNQSGHRVAMPWLDLTLSDAQGKPLLRRAVDPALLGAQAPLAVGEQRQLSAVFRVDAAGARVSGYEIGLFHP